MLIDTHCHLEKAFAKGQGDPTLERMQAAGVGRCITVGTCLQDWDFYYRLAGRERGRVDWTVGLHPCHVEEDWLEQVRTIPTFFGTDPMPVALGEIGLDYFHLPKYPDEAAEVRQRQTRAFVEQLQLAYQLDCPVIVHSRQAVEDCVARIDESGVNWERVVFHCFTDGPEHLQPILERGGRASFTGIITYRNAQPVREALLLQGPERLMLETDAPYLTPEPLRGQANEPGHVAHVARYAASLLGMTLDELANLTTRNAFQFFGLPTP